MVYEYDPANDAWTKKKSMPLLSHHVALAEVGHRLAEVDAAHTAAEDEWLALAEEAEG